MAVAAPDDDDSYYQYEDDFEDDIENDEAAHVAAHTHFESSPAATPSAGKAIAAATKPKSLADYHVDLSQSLALPLLRLPPPSNPKLNAAVKRAQALSPLIQLDYRSFEIFNIPPMGEYDVYMRRFGSLTAAMSQTSTQTGEDQLERDIQTEDVPLADKWTQHPAIGQEVGDGVRQLDRAGSGAQPASKVAKLMNALARKKRESMDSALALSRFLARAEPAVSALLEENVHRNQMEADVIDEVLGVEKLEQRKFLLSSPATCTQERLCMRMAFSAADVGAAVTAWWGAKRSDTVLLYFKSALAGHISRTLHCEGQASCLAFSYHQRATFIAAGTATGVVYIWDLREPDSNRVTVDGMSCYAPSYSTSMLTVPKRTPDKSTGKATMARRDSSVSLPDMAGHEAEVVSVEFVRDPDQAHPGAKQRTTQLVSVDADGCICIWMVTEQDSFNWLSSDPTDLGMGINTRVKLICTTRFSVPSPEAGNLSAALPLTAVPKIRSTALLSQGSSTLVAATDTGALVCASKFQFALEEYCRSYTVTPAAPVTQGARCVAVSRFTYLSRSEHACSLMLVGYDDSATVALFVSDHPSPVGVWRLASTASAASFDSSRTRTVWVAWSSTRPAVFYCLDSCHLMHVFDLTESAYRPALQVDLSRQSSSSGKRVPQCVALTVAGAVQPTKAGHQQPTVEYLGTAYDDGTVQVLKLAQYYVQAKDDEWQFMQQYIERNRLPRPATQTTNVH